MPEQSLDFHIVPPASKTIAPAVLLRSCAVTPSIPACATNVLRLRLIVVKGLPLSRLTNGYGVSPGHSDSTCIAASNCRSIVFNLYMTPVILYSILIKLCIPMRPITKWLVFRLPTTTKVEAICSRSVSPIHSVQLD